MRGIWSRGAVVGLVAMAMLVVAACAPAATPMTTPEPTPTATKVYEIKIQTLADPGNKWRLDKFKEILHSLSDGQLELTVYVSDEIVPNAEIHDACAKGVLQMGHSSGLYISNRMPIASVEAGLPFSYEAVVVDPYIYFYHVGFLPMLREAYSEIGLYYLTPIESGPSALFSKKKATTLADLRKLKIRAYGEIAKTFDKIGCTTTYVSGSEIYTAMGSGVIDAATWAGPSILMAMSLQEVAKYYYEPPVVGSLLDSLFVDLDFYNSLPPQLQSVLNLGAQAFNQWYATQIYYEDIEALSTMKEKYGWEVVTFDPQTIRDLTAAAAEVWDEVGATDPRTAQAVEMLKEFLRVQGRL